jgi:hypothetical protein
MPAIHPALRLSKRLTRFCLIAVALGIILITSFTAVVAAGEALAI